MDTATRLSAERVVLPTGVEPATVHVGGDGRIARVERGVRPGSTAVRGVLVPGLIDLQVNGRSDVDVWAACLDRDGEAMGRLDGLLLDDGVTTWLPTLVSHRLDAYATALRFLMQQAEHLVASIPGAHLEGPMLGSRPGAHRVEHITEPPQSWWDGVAPSVRLVTLGAESGRAPEVTRMLVERGVTVSIGHSAPTREQFDSVVDAGATMVTHLFNAMSGVGHRGDALALWALNDPRLCCGLIADGVHVVPEAVDLAVRASRGGVVLVTDSVAHLARATGPVSMAPASAPRTSVNLSVADGAPRLADGTLAGSCLTMTAAISNAMRWSGAGLWDTVCAATSVPARVLGLADRGEIAVGRRADLSVLVESSEGGLDIEAVWVAGLRVR